MPEYEQAVFISYAWGEDSEEREAIVNQLEQSLQKRGLNIERDKRVLGYKGSIRQFMTRIGEGGCVILVISDKYLRSKNCMFELIQISENERFNDRVFPVVLSDADIYDAVKRIEYIKYWETKKKELDIAMKSVSSEHLQGIRDEIDLFDTIRDEIANLTDTLQNMNTLTPDLLRDADFQQLYDAIQKRMKEVKKVDKGTASSEVSVADRLTARLRAGTSGSDRASSQQQKERNSRRSSKAKEELIISLRGQLDDAQHQLNEYIAGYFMLIEPWVDCGVAKSKLEKKDVSNDQYWREIKSPIKHAKSKISGNVPVSLMSIPAFTQFNDSLNHTLELIQKISAEMSEPERMQINNEAFDYMEDAVNMVDKIVEQCRTGANEKISTIERLITAIFGPDQEHKKASSEQVQKTSEAPRWPRDASRVPEMVINNENGQPGSSGQPAATEQSTSIRGE